MKTLVLSFLLLCSFSVFAQQGIMSIETKNINLGPVKANDIPTEVTFTFKNTGSQPILLSRVTPLTSLLKVQWDKNPVMPGNTSAITVSFVPANMPEKFNYTIHIQSNAQNQREQLRLEATIVDNPEKPALLYKHDMDGVRFKTAYINLGQIHNNQVITDTIYFFNTREKDIPVTTRYLPSHMKMTPSSPSIQPGQKGYIILSYDAKAKNDYGYVFDNIIFNFDNDNSYRHRLSVSANITEDFSQLSAKELKNAPVASFAPQTIDFGEIKPGDKANCDFKLTNTGQSNLIIRKTKASCGCTAITLGENTLAPGQSTTIRATFNSAGKHGRQYKSITVITNDPRNPETSLSISGNIAASK